MLLKILWLLIIIRFSNVVVVVAFGFGVSMFAQPLKQFSIEVDAGIKENIALVMPLRIGYSVSWVLKNKRRPCFFNKVSSFDVHVYNS